jgi:cysteine synthase
MRNLNPNEKLERRRRVLHLVERDLPSLRRVPIPKSVREADWFRSANIENILKVYAFPGFGMGTFSGKIFPALEAWLMDEAAGKFESNPIVIGATSGNWGKDSALIAPMFSVKGFRAVVNKSIPKGKLVHLRAHGAEVEFAPEGIPATDYVYKLAKLPGYHLIDQYVHEGSISGHRWSMGHIAREMEDKMGSDSFIFGAVTGTTSTLMAADRYLPNAQLFGVASMSRKEKVPGSRSPEDLDELKRIGGFPYQTVLDFPLITTVTRAEAYAVNVDLVQRALIPVGPTGALLEAGFYHLLRGRIESGELDALKNESGSIVAVLFFMDSWLPYLDDPEYASYFFQ